MLSRRSLRRTTRAARARLVFAKIRARALALRPEHHPGSDQSGHAEQPTQHVCSTRCPKEPHAQRSWHLQPFSGGSANREVWLAESLDKTTTSGPSNAAQSRAVRSHTHTGSSLPPGPASASEYHLLRATTTYGPRAELPTIRNIEGRDGAREGRCFLPCGFLTAHRNRRVTVTVTAVATRVQILFMKLIALLGLLPAAAALGYCNDKDSSCAHWGSKGESAWSSCPLGSAPARPLRLLRALLAALAGAALPGERPAHWAPDSSEPQGRRLHRL